MLLYLGGYKNHTTYAVRFTVYLYGKDENGTFYDPWVKDYTWTTDFTSAGIAKVAEDSNNRILNNSNYVIDYIQNSYEGLEYFNLPTLSVNDPTYSFFTNLFNTIQNAFTSFTNHEEITVNFLGTDYRVNSSFFNIFDDNSVMRNFLSLYWTFFLGYVIYRDLRKRIMNIREFDWTFAFDDDISIEIL